MIERILQNRIKNLFNTGKAILVLGPRQVGKTTLVQEILRGKSHLFLNADEGVVREQLLNPDTFRLQSVVGSHQIVFIDEVQRLADAGLVLKLLVDQFKHVQVIASGSSALEIKNKINEPLTGRKWEYYLYPISWEELEATIGFLDAQKQLEHRLIFGMYPDVINHPGQADKVLRQLAESYLYKDILSLAQIRKPELLDRLLKALALQIGNEVSYNELAQLLQVDKGTIMTYLDLLEKAFIIFRLGSLSRNLRNEIKNNRKVYFWDNGIRNILIANLNPLDLRQDKGALWENFLMAERMKYLAYHEKIVNPYFWRTVQQQEIDYVEESGGKIAAYEFKWKGKSSVKTPSGFYKAYQAEVQVITADNFRPFVGASPEVN
jgi:uncharacterized protein